MFEYFGSFNGVSAKEVRKNLLTYVSGNVDFVEKRSTVCLSMRSMDLDIWTDNINNGKPCDELGLLVLSAMYHRHSLVVTKNKTWCSIESSTPMNLIQALSACTVRLLYLGDLAFGVLKWKPQPVKPTVDKPRLGEFKIIEEYVETPLPDEHLATNASTSNIAGPNYSVFDKPVESSADTDGKTGPKVVYADDNQDFYVETVDHGNDLESAVDSPDSYPWKKKLCVSVRKLSDFEIAYWTGHNSQGDGLPIKVETEADCIATPVSNAEPAIIPVRSHLKKEPPTDTSKTVSSGDSTTEELLARAKSLIKRAQCASKTLSTSDEQQSTPNPSGTPQPANKNSKPPPTLLHVETTSVIKCQMCSHTCKSVSALSAHHRDDHGILRCNTCDKAFSTKAALDKHIYVHKLQKTFVCEECGQGFIFESRLLQHQITHSDEARYACNRGSCSKSFKNKGDLNRHVGTHSDKWFFCSKCTYKNKDKRNRDSHARVHEIEGNERYHCEKCGKGMRFSTQVKRHRESGCNLSNP